MELNYLKIKCVYILMELPIELQMIINEYAKPMTRPDWRKGCYFNRYIYDEYTFAGLIVLLMDDYDFTNEPTNLWYTGYT